MELTKVDINAANINHHLDDIIAKYEVKTIHELIVLSHALKEHGKDTSYIDGVISWAKEYIEKDLLTPDAPKSNLVFEKLHEKIAKNVDATRLPSSSLFSITINNLMNNSGSIYNLKQKIQNFELQKKQFKGIGEEKMRYLLAGIKCFDQHVDKLISEADSFLLTPQLFELDHKEKTELVESLDFYYIEGLFNMEGPYIWGNMSDLAKERTYKSTKGRNCILQYVIDYNTLPDLQQGGKDKVLSKFIMPKDNNNFEKQSL